MEPTSNIVEASKVSFLELISKFRSDSDRKQFLDWIVNEVNSEIKHNQTVQNYSSLQYPKITDGRNIVTRISNYIKDFQVADASSKGQTSNGSVWNSENIRYPEKFSIGGDSDDGLTPDNTIHLDSFLYDEADEDLMIEDGQLSRAFCKDCGSKNTEEITFVTHSCSKNTLERIFVSMLPSLNANHTVLDVGSRLGAVLYGAYVFSEAGKIFGIEINKDLCDLQKHVIEKFGLSNRVSVIHSDMTACSELFQSADVIILNNVFEWFVDPSQQVFMWQFLSRNIKTGALLVTIPSLEKSIDGLALGSSLQQWVKPYCSNKPNITPSDSSEDVDINLYQVINAFSNNLHQ